MPTFYLNLNKTLSTMSTMKNIMAQADVEEEFESEFGVYDLPEFFKSD